MTNIVPIDSRIDRISVTEQDSVYVIQIAGRKIHISIPYIERCIKEKAPLQMFTSILYITDLKKIMAHYKQRKLRALLMEDI